MRVEFITRDDCSLCDEAEAILSTWAKRFGLDVVVTDVDGDPELLELFTDRVPVLRSRAGDVLVEGRWSAEPPPAFRA